MKKEKEKWVSSELFLQRFKGVCHLQNKVNDFLRKGNTMYKM